jgi:nucleoid-associated protein YgaU
VRLNRSSLRISTTDKLMVACAALTLGLGVACGGGAAAPTPTAVPTTAVPPATAPSPQRPALASPVASPSVASTTSAAPTATVETTAVDTYEVQSGDTLLTIADHYYGDNSQWRRIYDANKDVIGPDPDKLKIGMKLKIPPKQS